MLNHKSDPRTLIFICLVSSSVILLSQSLLVQFYSLLYLLAFTLFSKGYEKKIFTILYKMRHLLITILLIQLLFRQGGQVYWQYSVLQISEAGIRYSLSALMRYSGIISGSLLLSTISLNEFLEVFHYYRLPRDLSLTVTFCIQYLSSFSRQIKHISQIIRQRNLYEGKNLFGKLFILKEVSLPLLIKSLSEVQYKAIALELKGISLKPRFKTSLKFKTSDYLIIVMTISLTVILLVKMS
ncbi:MAG TPA: energy-coupling factor transporter transmembrane component T [Candidatus Cloacimonadota bacterium]|nr:energy-coupling factor transporter transmembrane component T [Candidatus Cloacimonadota bacterium]